MQSESATRLLFDHHQSSGKATWSTTSKKEEWVWKNFKLDKIFYINNHEEFMQWLCCNPHIFIEGILNFIK